MAVNSFQIKKLDELIHKFIDEDRKISKSKIKRLTAPGENFGSIMLKVDLVLKDNRGETEELSIVAKMLPTSEFFQQVFNVQVSFKLEVAFYEVVVPTLQDFQREQGVKEVIDFFPKFYGARNNLNGTGKVDEDAVLLLENLKNSGKKITSRITLII